jgi:thioredoxin-dependent peroxiredoxin
MRFATIAAACALLAAPVASFAYLQIGASAPDFQTQGALGGKVFNLKLKEALKKGPVVLYFYPKAFTQGCTIEAHEFADATEDFQKAGATVIGMSADDIETLQRFSTQECRDKFAVAAANPAVIKAYDVAFGPPRPNATPEQAALMAAITNRTSFVIAPNGKVIFVYSAMEPHGHITKTLEAVRQWQAQNGKKS